MFGGSHQQGEHILCLQALLLRRPSYPMVAWRTWTRHAGLSLRNGNFEWLQLLLGRGWTCATSDPFQASIVPQRAIWDLFSRGRLILLQAWGFVLRPLHCCSLGHSWFPGLTPRTSFPHCWGVSFSHLHADRILVFTGLEAGKVGGVKVDSGCRFGWQAGGRCHSEQQNSCCLCNTVLGISASLADLILPTFRWEKY